MELYTVTQVTKQLNITKRTLGHYEELGLITSTKKEGYAYRMYDAFTILRIQQILVLRKLRIPLKQIAKVLQSDDAAEALEIFENKLVEIEDEINALSTIRNVIESFIQRLNVNAKLELLDDKYLLGIVNSIKLSKAKFNEVKELTSMENLLQANKTLDKLTDKDVRIVYQPPATVASLHFVGNDEEGRVPEEQGKDIIAAFIKNLVKIKPDFRHYGFNHLVDDKHGYEQWFTIPDDMEIPEPFVKKQFPGGVYGAYALRTWDNEWDLLMDWANNNKKYEIASNDLGAGLLEEHLNAMGQYVLPNVQSDLQIDLLVPLKEKSSEWPDALGYITDSETKCGYKTSLIEKKSFTMFGHKYVAGENDYGVGFFKQLADDGRLERMKSALKPNTPIIVFHYWQSGYCIAVGAAIQDAADKGYFKSEAMNVKKTIPKKRWLQFEMTMEEHSKQEKWDLFQLANKLGYKFDNSAGNFAVYPCRELEVTEENKDEPFYFWFPVRPL